MAKTSLPEWRKDWQSDLPVWDKNHPLYKLAVTPDDEPVEVANEYATTRLHLPNIDDGWLSDCIAKTAAIDRFQDAADLAPTVALESYAIFYLSIGGTAEALKRYNDALGIKRASQAQNDWQPLIRWIAGQAWDQSNRKPARISKFAALMQYWMLYLADDPKYTPHDTDEAVGPGTSSFARWVLECHGYGGFANDPPRPPFGAVQITDTSSSTVVNGDTRHRRMNYGWRVEWFVLANRAQIPTWHPIYIHLKSGAEAEAKAKELKALVPAVKALVVQPTTADYRIVGVLRVGDAHPLGVAVPPDHPGVNQWQSQRYASGERVWLSLPVGAYDTNYNSIAEAEAALAAEKEGPAPRPQPETVEDFSKEKLTTGTVEPPAKPKPPQKTNNEKPPTTVPKADWQKPQPFSTKHAGPITGGKVVDLDAEKAKHELEEKVAALEKERDQWKEKAARTEPAQWRDNPDGLAAVWAKLDANAAIDLYEALEQKLKGTPEWRAYLDERLEEHLNAARRIREQYAAEDKAALNADPKERRIARIKNALELALRVDTSEQEAIAAFAGARRLCEEGDLGFLARLTDLSRDPAPPERGIA